MATVRVVCRFIFFVYLNNLVSLFVISSLATFVDSPLKLKACCSNLTVPILYFSALVLLLHMYSFLKVPVLDVCMNNIIHFYMHRDSIFSFI